VADTSGSGLLPCEDPRVSEDGRQAGAALTPGQILALDREHGCRAGVDDGGPDARDAQAADDPDAGAEPWWLWLPPAEQAQALGVHPEVWGVPGPRVPFGAGFTRQYGSGGRGFAAGGEPDRMLPGSQLGWHVARARRRGWAALDDDALIGVLDANRRQKSWHDALELDVVTELARRRAAADGSPGEHVAEELAAALTLTSRSADKLLGVAADITRLQPALTLLANGIIDRPRAEIIARHLSPLSDADAAVVQDLILPRAAGMTTGQLDAACAHAVKAADPGAALRRKDKARKDARVESWAEPGGTAALAGRDLDPASVILIIRNLDTDAHWLKDHGADGSIDQLRAAAFTARLSGQPLSALLPQPPASGSDASAATGSPGAGGTSTGEGGADSTPGGLRGTVNLIKSSAFRALGCELRIRGFHDREQCLADRLLATFRSRLWISGCLMSSFVSAREGQAWLRRDGETVTERDIRLSTSMPMLARLHA
jgi:hypothetical protein